MQIRDKLYSTRDLLYFCLSHPGENVLETLRSRGGYINASHIMDSLQLLHRSLIATRDNSIANGPVLSAIRQVATFGTSLMRLDIRQESTRHRDVMNAITEHLGLGSFNKWSEDEKVAFLGKELQARSVPSYPCVGHSAALSPPLERSPGPAPYAAAVLSPSPAVATCNRDGEQGVSDGMSQRACRAGGC